MPLLLLVRPPAEKVTRGESHRIDEELTNSFRVYRYIEEEWQLEPREVIPGIVHVDLSRGHSCVAPSDSTDPVDRSFNIPTALGSKHMPYNVLSTLPLDMIELSSGLCEISYSNPKDLMNDPTGVNLMNLVEPGYPVFFHNVISIQDSCQCFMWKFIDDRRVYIAFRGSSCLSDSVADLVGIRVGSECKGMVNSSLLEQFKLIEPFLRFYMLKISDEIDSIVCTGHSIGGACASIAALVFAAHFSTKRVSCITLGAPRVGDRDFGRQYRESVHHSVRIGNSGDPICTIPKSNTYLHATDAISLGTDGQAECWPEDEDKDMWNLSWQEILFHLRASRLHHVVEYRDRVSRLLASVRRRQSLIGL